MNDVAADTLSAVTYESSDKTPSLAEVTPMHDDDRFSRLERTILELGSELFRMKSEVYSIKGHQDNFVEVMKGLKLMLDEKGLINTEDFENAVNLGQALSLGLSSPAELQIEEEIARIKKTSH